MVGRGRARKSPPPSGDTRTSERARFHGGKVAREDEVEHQAEPRDQADTESDHDALDVLGRLLVHGVDDRQDRQDDHDAADHPGGQPPECTGEFRQRGADGLRERVVRWHALSHGNDALDDGGIHVQLLPRAVRVLRCFALSACSKTAMLMSRYAWIVLQWYAPRSTSTFRAIAGS